MTSVDAARANHGTFSTKHAVGKHLSDILVPLKSEDDLPNAHATEGSSRTAGTARTTAHANLGIWLYVAELLVELHVHRVQIDGGTFG